MNVFLNVYSGRRNPNWELLGSDLDEFNKLFVEATHNNIKSAIGRSEFNWLGYRGFTLTEENDKVIFVYKSLISWDGNYYLDEDLRLEKWLIAKTKEYLPKLNVERFKNLI